MRLRRLRVEDYRVLRKLEIKFSPDIDDSPDYSPTYYLDFLVGVNGTGKSTVLRLLLDIMRCLERNNSPDYGFVLEYDLGDGDQQKTVKITNIAQTPDAIEVNDNFILDEPKAWIDDAGEPVRVDKDILPEIVVAFTTGSETAWKELEKEDRDKSEGSFAPLPQDLYARKEILQERAVQELPGWSTTSSDLIEEDLKEENEQTQKQKSRFPFIETKQLALVTLCGLLADLATSPDYPRLTEVLNGENGASIKGLSGFSLKFRLNQVTASPSDREFVEQLAQIATREPSTGRALRLGTDYLIIFDLTVSGQATAQAILEAFTNSLEFFKRLSRLYETGASGQSVLREVNIFIERTSSNHPENDEESSPPLHLLNWLSDGEQSFLARMCLFVLLGEAEALILLDEPEVHFNDFWKRKIVSNLDKALTGRHSHVLITTHSSITLTDVPREDILLLERNANHTSRSLNPGIRTLAASPNDILVHVFRAPYAAGDHGINHIDRVLQSLPNDDLEQRKKGIEHLLDQIGPGYWHSKVFNELLEVEQMLESIE